MKQDELKTLIRNVADDLNNVLLALLSQLDCGDNSCIFAGKKGGQRTNGGCRCLSGFPTTLKQVLTSVYMTWRQR